MTSPSSTPQAQQALQALEKQVQAMGQALADGNLDVVLATSAALRDSSSRMHELMLSLTEHTWTEGEGERIRRARAATNGLQEQLARRLLQIEEALQAVLPEAAVSHEPTYQAAVQPGVPRHGSAARLYRTQG
ncbi:hypothetical protein EC845_1074 [Comamonas sp. BIGb0124]|uniref:hypothetical protein n=1 Tax=Comamonas sp. BIGb0124 TaxID=2485130 RepID=UPI000FA3EA75|nr:hypothetical protein [Comamonas sp. BIGb0124]ROR25037.1 hypothetical protein EC845_1074 [Comamonas sp. BIGb0124]